MIIIKVSFSFLPLNFYDLLWLIKYVIYVTSTTKVMYLSIDIQNSVQQVFKSSYASAVSLNYFCTIVKNIFFWFD